MTFRPSFGKEMKSSRYYYLLALFLRGSTKWKELLIEAAAQARHVPWLWNSVCYRPHEMVGLWSLWSLNSLRKCLSPCHVCGRCSSQWYNTGKSVKLHHQCFPFSSVKLNVTFKARSYRHSNWDELKQNKKRSGVGNLLAHITGKAKLWRCFQAWLDSGI